MYNMKKVSAYFAMLCIKYFTKTFLCKYFATVFHENIYSLSIGIERFVYPVQR